MTSGMKKKATIGITLGDPGGIGPEITAKALLNPAVEGLADFILLGDQNIFDLYRKKPYANIAFHDHAIIPPCHSPKSITMEERGKAAYAYLQTAIQMLRDKRIDGVVTAPVNKQAIIASGVDDFSGHTEMFAQAFNVKQVEMMFVGGPYKTIIATRHIPLAHVPTAVTVPSLNETILLAHNCLQKTFQIKEPKIALCGINPHAGEGGRMGTEETDTLIPAITNAKQQGISVFGPLAADTLFIPSNAQQYDLIIAMYHDQGLAPIKALYFTQLVNFTVGLPFVRTSTAHGTAEDIAGQNKADSASMIESIKLACELTDKQKC